MATADVNNQLLEDQSHKQNEGMLAIDELHSGLDHLDASHHETEFSKIDAIRLVQEALDEILFEEEEDHLRNSVPQLVSSSPNLSQGIKVMPDQEKLRTISQPEEIDTCSNTDGTAVHADFVQSSKSLSVQTNIAIETGNYDSDSFMLKDAFYVQECRSSAMKEHGSSLTLSELEGSSRCSFKSDNDTSISERRKYGNVSVSLAGMSDETMFTHNQFNLINGVQELGVTSSSNKLSMELNDTNNICHEEEPMEVEDGEIKEEVILGPVGEIQNADDSTNDSQMVIAIDEPVDSHTSRLPQNSVKISKTNRWSNVKKMILVRRFIKKLEELKSFSPQNPKTKYKKNSENLPSWRRKVQWLVEAFKSFLRPAIQDSAVTEAAETISLVNLKTEDKKNDEEWMLDHALQQAVSGLSSPRKRKVQLLVDAFETASQSSTRAKSIATGMPAVNQDSDESRGNRASRRPFTKTSLEWTIASINIILEALSAAFDQVSSPNKPRYALIALVMSVIAVVLCIGEFVYRAREANVVLRRRGLICWFSHPPPDYKPFGTLSDIFGLICAVFQCIFSVIQYAYFSHHADNPLKISVLPLIFALCCLF